MSGNIPIFRRCRGKCEAAFRSSEKFLSIDKDQFVQVNAREEDAAIFRVWDWGQDAYSFTDADGGSCMTVSKMARYGWKSEIKRL